MASERMIILIRFLMWYWAALVLSAVGCLAVHQTTIRIILERYASRLRRAILGQSDGPRLSRAALS